MSHPVIEADECIGCGICVDACPQEVLEVVGGVAEVVNCLLYTSYQELFDAADRAMYDEKNEGRVEDSV